MLTEPDPADQVRDSPSVQLGPSPRLPQLRPDRLTPEQRAVYERVVESRGTEVLGQQGELRGPFNAMLYTPAVGAAVQQVGAAIRFSGQLPDRIRELAILETAVRAGCSYEWHIHSSKAIQQQLFSADEVTAISLGVEDISTLSPPEHLARRVAVALIEVGDLDDLLFDTALEILGLPLISELVFLIGYYQMLARSIRVWRVTRQP